MEFKFLKFDIEDEDPTDDYKEDLKDIYHCEFDALEMRWKDLDMSTRFGTTGRLCHFVEKERHIHFL